MRDDAPAAPFASLFDVCLDCGSCEQSVACASCRTAEVQAPPVPALLGARISSHTDGRPATIVGIGPDPMIEVLSDHGTTRLSPHDQLPVAPVLLTSGHDLGERLLIAAFHWDLPPTAAEAVLSAAAAAVRKAPRPQQLRFAERAYTMGRPELAASLKLQGPTVLWLTAQRQLSRGDVQAAAKTLLDIPEGHFPARLGVWAMAADGMSEDVGRRVLERLGEFSVVGSPQEVAATTLRHALVGGNPAGVAEQVRASMPALADHFNARLESGGSTPATRLLQMVRSEPDQLALHPDLLADAHPALLDDLIADGVIDSSWLDRQLPAPVQDYVAARLDPARLDNDALVAFGLHEERARRAVSNGRPLPNDLPDDIGLRYGVVMDTSAARQDPDRVATTLGIDPRLRPEFDEALARPGRLPSDRLLRSTAVWWLLGRIAIDALALEDLDSGELTTSQQCFAATVALERGRRALQAWDYAGSANHGKTALRLCDRESIRDEALNLIACASWQLGNDEAAIRALETALEGEYNLALQANIGVIAQQLRPDVAAKHLSKLITDAPTLQLRVEAAKRTLSIWDTRDLPDENVQDLPTELARLLRPLLDEPIDPGDFRLFARLLSDHDAAWMAGFSERSSSAGARSAAGVLFSARARGFDEYVKSLSRLLGADTAEPWLVEERDRLIGSIRGELVSENPHLGAVALAELVLDESLPIDLDDEIVLCSLTARAVAFALVNDEGGEPADRFLDRLEASARRIAEVDEADRAPVTFAVRWGYDAMTRACLLSRWQQLRQAADLHDHMLAEMVSAAGTRRNRQIAEQASGEIQKFAQATRTLMRRLRPHVDDELGQHVDQLLEACDRLEDSARRQLRM